MASWLRGAVACGGGGDARDRKEEKHFILFSLYMTGFPLLLKRVLSPPAIIFQMAKQDPGPEKQHHHSLRFVVRCHISPRTSIRASRGTMDGVESDLELLHEACESGDVNMVAAMHTDPSGPDLNE